MATIKWRNLENEVHEFGSLTKTLIRAINCEDVETWLSKRKHDQFQTETSPSILTMSASVSQALEPLTKDFRQLFTDTHVNR